MTEQPAEDDRYVVVDKNLIDTLEYDGVIDVERVTTDSHAEATQTPNAIVTSGSGETEDEAYEITFQDEVYHAPEGFDLADFCAQNPDQPLCR